MTLQLVVSFALVQLPVQWKYILIDWSKVRSDFFEVRTKRRKQEIGRYFYWSTSAFVLDKGLVKFNKLEHFLKDMTSKKHSSLDREIQLITLYKSIWRESKQIIGNNRHLRFENILKKINDNRRSKANKARMFISRLQEEAKLLQTWMNLTNFRERTDYYQTPDWRRMQFL